VLPTERALLDFLLAFCEWQHETGAAGIAPGIMPSADTRLARAFLTQARDDSRLLVLAGAAGKSLELFTRRLYAAEASADSEMAEIDILRRRLRHQADQIAFLRKQLALERTYIRNHRGK